MDFAVDGGLWGLRDTAGSLEGLPSPLVHDSLGSPATSAAPRPMQALLESGRPCALGQAEEALDAGAGQEEEHQVLQPRRRRLDGSDIGEGPEPQIQAHGDGH